MTAVGEDEAVVLPATTGRSAFYSVAAQEDNLGDVVIRRNVLRWITSSTPDVHVFRGSMTDSYLAAFDLPSSVVVHESNRAFAASLLRSCLNRRAAVVYAPGPRVASTSVNSARSAAEMLAMTGLTRISRGPAIAVGGAVRGGPSLALGMHRISSRISTDYSVRDHLSMSLLRGGRLIPDVAFADADPPAGMPGDPSLVISLRSDRDIDLAALRALVRRAQVAGIRPIVLTQVRRDEDNHRRLATELGVDCCHWQEQSHAEQLDRIDLAYRNAAAVFSNRLHACIFGARHGAVIFNAEVATGNKLESTLSAVYPADMVSTRASEGFSAYSLDDLPARRLRQAEYTVDASRELESERSRIMSALARS